MSSKKRQSPPEEGNGKPKPDRRTKRERERELAFAVAMDRARGLTARQVAETYSISTYRVSTLERHYHEDLAVEHSLEVERQRIMGWQTRLYELALSHHLRAVTEAEQITREAAQKEDGLKKAAEHVKGLWQRATMWWDRADGTVLKMARLAGIPILPDTVNVGPGAGGTFLQDNRSVNFGPPSTGSPVLSPEHREQLARFVAGARAIREAVSVESSSVPGPVPAEPAAAGLPRGVAGPVHDPPEPGAAGSG